jgi:hypothetical protein
MNLFENTLSVSAPLQPTHMLYAAAFIFGTVALAMIKYLVEHIGNTKRTSTVGLDAAEKGDTHMAGRSLAERVPYGLEKRAILHKASRETVTKGGKKSKHKPRTRE